MSEQISASPGMIAPNRLEAFSDGVFAIATTLLILEIKVPHAAEGQLGSALVQLWPSYAAYALGFATIGVMWLNHHFLIGLVRRVDRPILFLNLGLLGIVAFIPFPTAVIAEYLVEGSTANLGAASAFYGLTMLALALFFTGMWWHLRRAPFIVKDPDVAAPVQRRALLFCAIAGGLYLVAALLSFALPLLAIAIYAVVVVLFTVVRLAR